MALMAKRKLPQNYLMTWTYFTIMFQGDVSIKAIVRTFFLYGYMKKVVGF